MATSFSASGRVSKTQRIADHLRTRLSDRSDALDTPLTERGVAQEYDVSRMTARQALRRLVDSGHLQVDPSVGYWPANPARSGVSALRIAFVTAGGRGASTWPRHLGDLWSAIQQTVLAAGGEVTAIGEPDPGNGRLADRLADVAIDGVILDCAPDVAAEVVNELVPPCVVVNTPIEAASADVLVQDNATGGYLAARHLLELGHRRIGWLGWPTDFAHGRERFGGFLAALAERGLSFDAQCAAFAVDEDHAAVDRAAEQLLAQEPTAMVVLWAAMAARVTRRCREAGLSLPEDLRLVTWGASEGFAQRWHVYCGGPEPLPDAIHWRMKDMVDSALSRLAERMRHPLSPPVKLFMPVHLEVRNAGPAATVEAPGLE